MAMGNGEPKTARLPKSAPEDLKRFVACDSDRVVMDADKLDWIPDGPLGDFAPDPEVKPGEGENQVVIEYGILELPATIGEDGALEVDLSGVPTSGPFSFLGDGIKDWVADFNATLKFKRKGLSGISVSGGKVTLTKQSIGATEGESTTGAVTPGPGVQPTPPAPSEPSPPTKPPAPQPPAGGGGGGGFLDMLKRFWKMLVGFFIFLLALIGIVVWTGGDDTPDGTGDGEDVALGDDAADSGDSANDDGDESLPPGSGDDGTTLVDLGVLPVFPDDPFTVTIEPIDGCGVVETMDSISIRPFPSSRGLAAGFSGGLDGTAHMGNNVFNFEGRTAYITRNEVTTLDVDRLTNVDFGPDAFTGEWRHIELEGDVDEIGPGEGTCVRGGMITVTGPGYVSLRDAINAAPPLDQDVPELFGFTCRRAGEGVVLVGSLLPAPGEVSVRAEISGEEYLDLGSMTVPVENGSFEALFPDDGDETHIGASVSAGVYSLGGAFFDDCGP